MYLQDLNKKIAEQTKRSAREEQVRNGELPPLPLDKKMRKPARFNPFSLVDGEGKPWPEADPKAEKMFVRARNNLCEHNLTYGTLWSDVSEQWAMKILNCMYEWFPEAHPQLINDAFRTKQNGNRKTCKAVFKKVQQYMHMLPLIMNSYVTTDWVFTCISPVGIYVYIVNI